MKEEIEKNVQELLTKEVENSYLEKKLNKGGEGEGEGERRGGEGEGDREKRWRADPVGRLLGKVIQDEKKYLHRIGAIKGLYMGEGGGEGGEGGKGGKFPLSEEEKGKIFLNIGEMIDFHTKLLKHLEKMQQGKSFSTPSPSHPSSPASPSFPSSPPQPSSPPTSPALSPRSIPSPLTSSFRLSLVFSELGARDVLGMFVSFLERLPSSLFLHRSLLKKGSDGGEGGAEGEGGWRGRCKGVMGRYAVEELEVLLALPRYFFFVFSANFFFNQFF